MRFHVLFLAWFLALFSGVLAGVSPADERPLRDLDYERARAVAASERKPLLLVFRDDGADSRRLESTVYIDSRSKPWISASSIAIEIDWRLQHDLARRMRVHEVPTFVFMDERGIEIGRVRGLVDGRALRAEGDAALNGVDQLERARARVAAAPTDLLERLDLAGILADRGLYAEAGTHYLALWDQRAPGFETKRLGFLREEIARLGRVHPAIYAELLARARPLADAIQTGRATFEQIDELARLCTTARQPERLLTTYDAVLSNGLSGTLTRWRLAPHVHEALFDAGRFRELADLLGDPRTTIDERARALAASTLVGEALERERAAALEAGLMHYETLLRAKRFDDANSLADLLVVADPRGATWAGLIRRGVRTGAMGEADSLRRRALAARGLTPAEREEVRSASLGIIRAKKTQPAGPQ